jgi:hypothetical protein
VPANRINTPSGSDVSIIDQGWAEFSYDATDSRWKLRSTYPTTATATNAVGTSGSSITNVGLYGWTTNNGMFVWKTNVITEGNVAYGGFAATNAISFTNGSRQKLLLTNSWIWLNTTNMTDYSGADEVDVELEIIPQHFYLATNRVVVLNSSWKRFSGAITNTIGSNKVAFVRIRRTGTTEASVRVSFEPEL